MKLQDPAKRRFYLVQNASFVKGKIAEKRAGRDTSVTKAEELDKSLDFDVLSC